MDKIKLKNGNGKEIKIDLDDIQFIECVINDKAFIKNLNIKTKDKKEIFHCINNQDINNIFYYIFKYLKNKRR